MSLLIRFGESDLSFNDGEYLIGRDPECDIFLEDRVASRKHAKLVCRPMTYSVEDLGSSNGTFVNGTPLRGPRLLVPGDIIIVGRTELEVRSMETQVRPPRRRAVTVDDHLAVRPDKAAPQDTSTGQKDVVDLLAGVAQRAIDHGNPAQAEKVLAPVLGQLLDGARKGSPPPPDVVASACRHALTLANATEKGEWLDYVIETYWHSATPIPSPVALRLAAMWRRMQGTNVDLLRAYIDRLRANPAPMTGNAAESIATLEKLVERR